MYSAHHTLWWGFIQKSLFVLLYDSIQLSICLTANGGIGKELGDNYFDDNIYDIRGFENCEADTQWRGLMDMTSFARVQFL